MGNLRTIYIEDGDTVEIRVQRSGTPKNKTGWEDMEQLGRSSIFINFACSNDIRVSNIPRPQISLMRINGEITEKLCDRV